MRAISCAVLLASFTVVAPDRAMAQIPVQFAVEGRLAYASALGLWNLNNELERGFGTGLNAQMWIANRLGIYGGWESNRFSVARTDLQEGVDSYAADRGFRLGLMTPYPLPGAGRGVLIIYGGGTLTKTSFVIHDNREALSVTSNRELGYEAGTGINIPLGQMYVLTPGVRYRRHEAVFGPPTEAGPNETTVEYIVADIGIRINVR